MGHGIPNGVPLLHFHLEDVQWVPAGNDFGYGWLCLEHTGFNFNLKAEKHVVKIKEETVEIEPQSRLLENMPTSITEDMKTHPCISALLDSAHHPRWNPRFA